MVRRPTHRNYSRMARVNQLLREVLGDAIEIEAGSDARLEMMTVTAVDCDPDLRHARVLFASLPAPAAEALGEVRHRLQAAIARQVRVKRTPQLSFAADPAVAYGERVEDVLRSLRERGELEQGVACGPEAVQPSGAVPPPGVDVPTGPGAQG